MNVNPTMSFQSNRFLSCHSDTITGKVPNISDVPEFRKRSNKVKSLEEELHNLKFMELYNHRMRNCLPCNNYLLSADNSNKFLSKHSSLLSKQKSANKDGVLSKPSQITKANSFLSKSLDAVENSTLCEKPMEGNNMLGKPLESMEMHAEQGITEQIKILKEDVEYLKKELDVQCKNVERSNRECLQLKSFMEDAAVKQTSARLKLEEFIDDLIERVVTAEAALENAAARSAYSSPAHSDITVHNIRQSKSFGEDLLASDSGIVCDPHDFSDVAPCSGRSQLADFAIDNSLYSLEMRNSKQNLPSLIFNEKETVHSDVFQSAECFEDQQLRLPEIVSSDILSNYDNGNISSSSTSQHYVNLAKYIPKDLVETELALKRREAKLREEFKHQRALLGMSRRKELPRDVRTDHVCLANLPSEKRGEILMLVFRFLTSSQCFQMGLVCREWRCVSQNPLLWKSVTFSQCRMRSQLFKAMSNWCVKTESIVLEGLVPHLSLVDARSIADVTEKHFESLLQVAAKSLTTVRIIDCDDLLDIRVLIAINKHCYKLSSLTWISNKHAVNHDVISSLATGCRHLTTLVLPPPQNGKVGNHLNKHSLETIAQSWTNLRVLCIGGPATDRQGLLTIVTACQQLIALELEKAPEIDETVAVSLCNVGLQKLHTLELTFTPVTPRALVHFCKNCRLLKRLSVAVGISDYFVNPDSVEARTAFKHIVNKLQVLSKQPGLCQVLHIQTDYG